MEHFKYFPKIEYGKETLTNLMVRGKIRDHILEQNALYYEYTINDSDRPDTISTKYYGSPNYTWAIFYANNIFDPIHDWPLTPLEFEKDLKAKTGSLSVAQITPHHYLLDDKYIIDETTYNDPLIEADRKQIVTVYEHYFNINEEKRNIKIIDSIHLRQIVNELRVLFQD